MMHTHPPSITTCFQRTHWLAPQLATLLALIALLPIAPSVARQEFAPRSVASAPAPVKSANSLHRSAAAPAAAAAVSFAQPIPIGSADNETFSVALGDLNGDGALDLVLGNSGQPSQVYLNDGHAGFDTPNDLSGSGRTTASIGVGDLNGDGALDLVLANSTSGQLSQVYLNDRQGSFVTQFDLAGSGHATRSVAIGDLNGDSAFDLILGNSDQPSQVYLNDGHAGFAAPTDLAGSGFSTQSVALGDLNGDGALDLVLGNNNQPSQVYLNDGKGGFLAATILHASGLATLSIALGDLNGDGALDIILGNGGGDYGFLLSFVPKPSQVYLNDGQGGFAAPIDIVVSGGPTQVVAVGDLNGDGALDLVRGAGGTLQGAMPSQVYLNTNDGTGNFGAAISLPLNGGVAQSVAVGDLDGDGALDLIFGNKLGQPSQMYLNAEYSGFATSADLPASDRSTQSAAVGDLDGKNGLDLILGNADQPSQVYLNDGHAGFATSVDLPASGRSTQSVTVGDLDGKDGLDLILGNTGQPSQVYFNDGHAGFAASADLPASGRSTQSAAVGDLNGDGALDIVLGNADQPSQVYLHNRRGGFVAPYDLTTRSPRSTQSVAVGDLNGDGALDIVLGNSKSDNNGHYVRQPSQVYLNRGRGDFAAPTDLPGSGRPTQSVAVGDLNADGALDIVLGNTSRPSQVYLNDGHGGFVDPIDLPASGRSTASVGMGDLNGDGALDIVLGNYRFLNVTAQSQLYLNDGHAGFATPIPLLADSNFIAGVAVGDLDNTGALDLVVANSIGASQVYLNGRTSTASLPNNSPAVAVVRPGSANANFYSTPKILQSEVIPIDYTLFDREGDPVGVISATFSLDGGGSWRPAVASPGLSMTDLEASRDGTAHSFFWNTFASRVFGQSDNVVFRIIAYPSVKPIANGVPGPYQRPYASATTFPFRVRGTQVYVPPLAAPAAAPDTLTHKLFLPAAVARVPGSLPMTELPETGALVYRIRPGQIGTPLADAAGQPFRTNAQGYLQGRGEVAEGDQLVALQPIAATSVYTVYLTNATPTDSGLNGTTVTAAGVQTLTLSRDNPLLLFNLTVSLEWDARNDTAFLSQLRFDLQRTSELLYDWTNGQAALADITVYHAKAHWDDANIRLNASNRLRPSANQGGIAEPFNQIRIGAVWNRFGDPGGNQGEDWPRALAHELGHYAFSLDDNYLGLDGAGKLISVDGCPGAMSDPYRDDQSEFRPRADWLPGCQDTLANRTTGQADWETIVRIYPWLHAPTEVFKKVSPGPSRLPLAVTQIHFVAPADSPAPLAAPVFNLIRAEDGGRRLPGDRARAFLFKRSGSQISDLIDLGRPALDQVTARGAAVGDRLCVYELEAARLGCTMITAGTTQLALGTRAKWHPQLIVTPVTSRTLTLTVPADAVGQPAPPVLVAQVFPSDVSSAPSSAMLTLQNGQYQGDIILSITSLEGYVHVSVPNDSAPGREIVTDYALGGNPAPPRRPRRRTRRRAPAMSTDGQVILYGKNLDFANGEFYAIQTATALPPPPSWATFVGQGYRLIASPGAPPLEGVAMNVSYADSDVATGTANGVSLYRWNDVASAWQLLPGGERGVDGEVSTPISQAGLYVLMSSAEIELSTGLNLVAYPIAGTRPVGKALASIAGAYTTVRSYDPATGRWLVYTAGAPEYANSLKELEYGKGYEIRVTRDVTLLLRGEDAQPATALARIAPPAAFPPAPARYYGVVGFGVAGQAVQALIDGHVCGTGQTQSVAGQLVYALDVAADATLAGCGAPDRRVTLTLDGRVLARDVAWDNQQAREVNLGAP